jgi:hypothetical protein
MRALTLVLALTFLFCIKSSAQKWAQEGTIWHYKFESYGWTGLYKSYLKMRASDLDTIIHGDTCRILLRSIGGDKTFEKLYINQKGGKLFQYDIQTDSFYKVFDFDADTGSSWVLVLPVGGNEYDSILVTTNAKDTTTINAKPVRTIFISLQHLGQKSHYTIPMIASVTEFVGYTQGDFFPWEIKYVDGPEIGPLRCYLDPYFGFKQFTAEECAAGVKKEDVRPNFRIFPNPASQSITIEFITPCAAVPIEIYDITGNEHARVNWDNMHPAISLDGIKPGLYIVRVGSHTEKLLIK